MSDETDDNPEPSRKTFDRFDGRGTHLAELLVFVDGPPLAREMLVAHGINARFVHVPGRERSQNHANRDVRTGLSSVRAVSTSSGDPIASAARANIRRATDAL